MMRRFDCRDPKSTHMTLTLANQSIMYPYGILEDELVMVDILTLPSDFVILYMPKDTKILLIHGSSFMETIIALIYVELCELSSRFNKEQVVFNVFDAIKHQHEQPKCYKAGKMRKSYESWIKSPLAEIKAKETVGCV